MTRVRDVVVVPLPPTVAQKRIMDFFDSHRGSDGAAVLPLRVPLGDFGLPDTVSIERDVDISAVVRRDQENINDEIAISWAPAGGGPYPAFSGRIIVWTEETPGQSYVELDGTYDPPLQTFGQAFDKTIGYLIAARTAHELLMHIRKAISAKTPA